MRGFNPKNVKLNTDGSVDVDRAFPARISLSATEAVLGTATAAHAAVTDTGVEQVVTTAITNPTYPRNVTATAGGTAASIKAIQVIIEGTNFADEVITETLPAFTVDTAGMVTGNKAFKTITSITIPAHDAVSATTAIGYGTKLGLPYKLAHNTMLMAYRDNTKEGTLPTVAVSATALESNTAILNSALNGTVVDLYLLV